MELRGFGLSGQDCGVCRIAPFGLCGAAGPPKQVTGTKLSDGYECCDGKRSNKGTRWLGAGCWGPHSLLTGALLCSP